MKLSQTIIKSVATGLGLFLAAIIIFSIVTVISSIFGIIPFFSGNEQYNTTSVITEIDSFNSIDADIDYGTIYVKNGDTYKIEAINVSNNFKYKVKNNELVIDYAKKNSFLNTKNNNSKIIITIPKEANCDNYDFEIGASKLYISDLEIANLKLTIGAGDANVINLKITEDFKLKVGAGNVKIKDANINTMDVDIGAGNADITSILKGITKIDCGVGNVDLNILGYKELYEIRKDKGIGNITEKESLNYDQDKIYIPENKINLDVKTGVGNININFVKK